MTAPVDLRALLEAANYPPTWPHGRELTEAEQRTVDTDLLLRRSLPQLLDRLERLREAGAVLYALCEGDDEQATEARREWLAAVAALSAVDEQEPEDDFRHDLGCPAMAGAPDFCTCDEQEPR